MEMDELYTELILEHNQDKRNKRLLENPTIDEHGHNPSCGDDLTLQLTLDGVLIRDAAYTGQGCAISQASASMMIDLVKGKTVEEALRYVELFLGMIKREITEEEELEALEDAMALQNISRMPARVKCAVLAWHTLRAALKER